MPPCPICRARNPISHRTKKGQFSIRFCSILCIKYFLVCIIKRYVIMFFVYKNRFLARQIGNGRSGTVMAFIPDNISAHVHLLDDNDLIKKTKDGCCQLGFSVFHKNNKSVSVKIMTGLSLSILSAEKSQSIQLQTFSSCGAHIRSGDNIFLLKLERQQCACNGPLESLLITRKMHLYRHLSRFLGRLLDFSSV